LKIILAIVMIILATGASRSNNNFVFGAGYDYALKHISPSTRELIIRRDGSEPASYILQDCWVSSSETGAFPIIGGRDPAPLVAVLCQTGKDLRSLFIFAPNENALEPIYALERKLALGIRVTNTIGIQVSWREPTSMNGVHYNVWEPNRGMAHSQRFSDAREPAFGKQVLQDGVLPEGLTPGDYVMTRSRDIPLRLGPSEHAPWFQRAGNDLMIHLEGGDPNWYGADIWVIGNWRRLCPVEGGCGYVSATEVLQLR
jgi:hypothetical protein